MIFLYIFFLRDRKWSRVSRYKKSVELEDERWSNGSREIVFVFFFVWIWMTVIVRRECGGIGMRLETSTIWSALAQNSQCTIGIRLTPFDSFLSFFHISLTSYRLVCFLIIHISYNKYSYNFVHVRRVCFGCLHGIVGIFIFRLLLIIKIII